MLKVFLLGAAALACAAPSVAAVTYNSAPTDGWFYGAGNGYSPANTAVSSFAAGTYNPVTQQVVYGTNQFYLRFHERLQTAPASDSSGVYTFAAGTSPLNFDFGLDESGGEFIGLSMTIENLDTNQSFVLSPRDFPDNAIANGSTQNSAQLNWFANEIGFNPNVAGRYRVTLSGNPSGGSQTETLSIIAQINAVSAVPEPAAWAMMVGGFGLLGAAARRRARTSITFA